MSGSDAVLGLEPADLDGHTIEELGDYLDAGRQPADPSIDDSPACRIALSALERLRAAAGRFLDEPGDDADDDSGWIATVLAALPLEARAGRSFPLAVAADDTAAEVTEGALRGLVRALGDGVDGLLVGRVRIQPLPDAPEQADLEIEAALRYGTRLEDADRELRAALDDRFGRHAPFAIRHVHIRVVSVVHDPDRQVRR